MDKIKFEKINISVIELLEKNPRNIEESEFDKLCEDIRNDPEFLYQRPPLINFQDGKYKCYAGTQRVRAAGAIGLTEIFCFIENDVPEHLQDERMIKDNLHRGTWDEQKLLDFSWPLNVMSDFGFKEFEVSIFDTFTPREPEDLVAELKEAPPTMKITFSDTRQMEFFENKLKGLIEDYERLATIKYSVSQGEI